MKKMLNRVSRTLMLTLKLALIMLLLLIFIVIVIIVIMKLNVETKIVSQRTLSRVQASHATAWVTSATSSSISSSIKLKLDDVASSTMPSNSPNLKLLEVLHLSNNLLRCSLENRRTTFSRSENSPQHQVHQKLCLCSVTHRVQQIKNHVIFE